MFSSLTKKANPVQVLSKRRQLPTAYALPQAAAELFETTHVLHTHLTPMVFKAAIKEKALQDGNKSGSSLVNFPADSKLKALLGDTSSVKTVGDVVKAFRAKTKEFDTSVEYLEYDAALQKVLGHSHGTKAATYQMIYFLANKEKALQADGKIKITNKSSLFPIFKKAGEYTVKELYDAVNALMKPNFCSSSEVSVKTRQEQVLLNYKLKTLIETLSGKHYSHWNVSADVVSQRLMDATKNEELLKFVGVSSAENVNRVNVNRAISENSKRYEFFDCDHFTSQPSEALADALEKAKMKSGPLNTVMAHLKKKASGGKVTLEGTVLETLSKSKEMSLEEVADVLFKNYEVVGSKKPETK